MINDKFTCESRMIRVQFASIGQDLIGKTIKLANTTWKPRDSSWKIISAIFFRDYLFNNFPLIKYFNNLLPEDCNRIDLKYYKRIAWFPIRSVNNMKLPSCIANNNKICAAVAPIVYLYQYDAHNNYVTI